MHARAFACGLWLLSCTGCGDDADPKAPRAVAAELSDGIATVVHVAWKTDEPSIGYVQYGPTEALDLNTPIEAEPGQEHRISLLGLHADTLYYYRVVTWEEGDAGASAIAEIRTGDLPVGMPPLTLEGDGHDQFTLVPILGATTAIVVLDAEGEIVWYHRDDRDLDFYRARLSLDGKSIIYNAGSVSGEPSDQSELVRVALDGSGESSIPVPLLAHDFVELPDGTLAAIVVEDREIDGETVRGNKIVEIDSEGEQTTVFSTWDCFDPAESPGDDTENGWTMANALDYDPAEDAYYLGMRNQSSIVKIDRESGECAWVLGTGYATLKFAPGSARFLHQHQFQVEGNRILVMDNDGGLRRTSRVVEYELDLDTMLATEVWSYVADPTVYTFVLGEPIRYDSGETFVNWSAAGQMERIAADGVTSQWKLNTGAGFVFGFHTLADSLYPASSRTP